MRPLRKCCVASCGETDDKKYSFFRFPDHAKTAKRWKTFIGLPNDYVVDRNTFVCVKHFTARDIVQCADRSTGQTAKLRFGSTPRLLLEPIKTEGFDDLGETSGAPDERSTPTKPPSNFDPSNPTAAASSLPSFESNIYVHKCPECTETFSTSAQLINHTVEWHKRKRSRLKASELLKQLKPSEVIQSSDSDCDYEITYNVKRIPKLVKKTRFDDTIVNSEKPPEPLIASPPVKAIEPLKQEMVDRPETLRIEPPKKEHKRIEPPKEEPKWIEPAKEEPKRFEPTREEPKQSSVIFITVPPAEMKTVSKLEPLSSSNTDDFDDLLTSSLIMKPKKHEPALKQTNTVYVNPLDTLNFEKPQPPEPSIRNIMIASINADGQIIETMTTEDETSHIIEEDYTDLDLTTEEIISPIIAVAPQKPRVQVLVEPEQKKPSPKRGPTKGAQQKRQQKPKEAAPKKITTPLAATTSTAAVVPPGDYDSDDTACDGAIRKCLECKMCKWMFLSTKKLKRHLSDVHRLMLGDSDLSKFTKTYPYKNIKPANGVRAFACSVCLRMYSNVNALKKHQIIQHSAVLGLDEKPNETKATPQNNNIHVCHVCRKSFLDPENLRSHLLLHVDGKSEDSVYKCDQCGQGFEYEAALTKHTIENHATLRLYSCEYCNDAFASSADLYEHVQEHVDKNDQPTNHANVEGSNISELYLACPEDDCDLAFRDSNSYYWHILYEHRKVYQDDPKFIEFLQMVDPDSLVQTEEPTQPEPEVEPEKIAAAVAEQQEAQHTKNNNEVVYTDPTMRFTCKLCDRKFTHLSFLKAHEMGKSRIKYECSACDVKTFSKVCLVRHFNVYHDSSCERLHFCNECPKSFLKKTQLLKHMDRHQSKSKQQKIYHCNLDGCDRVFADATTYNFHLSRLHPHAKNVGAFECLSRGCNARYRNEIQLKHHISVEHNIRPCQGFENERNEEISEVATKAEEIFFGHSDKFVSTATNGSMPELNLGESFMPEILNDVCNEVTIYTDLQ